MTMPQSQLKAREIEALTFSYSPPPTSTRTERRHWWRSSMEGHFFMVGVTVVAGVLTAVAWLFVH
jgi:hypothetical protein